MNREQLYFIINNFNGSNLEEITDDLKNVGIDNAQSWTLAGLIIDAINNQQS